MVSSLLLVYIEYAFDFNFNLKGLKLNENIFLVIVKVLSVLCLIASITLWIIYSGLFLVKSMSLIKIYTKLF